MIEETVKIRYKVKFEKRVTETRYDNEEHGDFIDRIAQNLSDEDAIDADIIEVDDIEEMSI